MRASTEKALAEAKRRCEAHDIKVKPDGFKYHTERVWLGVAENDDLILVKVPKTYKETAPEELRVFVYSTLNSRELDVRSKAAQTKKKDEYNVSPSESEKKRKQASTN